MELLSYALLTLEELKLYLGIDSGDTSEDEYLKLLINNSTEILNSAVGYIIAEQNYDGIDNPLYIQRGEESKELVLPFRNITDTVDFQIEVSELENDGDWTVIESDTYWVRKKEAIIEYNDKFTTWYNYRFTFSAGYNPIPYDIKSICMSMIAQVYNTQGTEGIKSEKIDTYSISYMENKTIQLIQPIINKYGL